MNTKSNLSNIFMGMIYEKVDRAFPHIFKYLSHKKKLKKFRRDIHEGSPGFGLLWKMADFIKLAEMVFFYNNSIKTSSEFGLYSSRNYCPGENGFKITTNECTIAIKLNSEYQKVMVEVVRSFGDKTTSSLVFINEQWDSNPSIYDEMLLEQVIKIINDRILKLFDYCYSAR